MSIRMRIEEMILATEAEEYHFSFTSPCTVLQGPVGTGKSSLLELIKFALGGTAVLTPVVRSEVRAVQARVNLAGSPLTLRRGLGRDAATVQVIDSRDEGEVRRFSVRPRPDQQSLSDALLEILGIPRVKIPRARTRATGASVPLTFNDLYAYLYVEQQDIDRSVVHHTEFFREPKRRAVFELLFGLADADQLAAETELGQVRDALRDARERATTVQHFLFTASVQDEVALRQRQLDFGAAADAAAADLDRLRAEVTASTTAHRGLREQVLAAEKAARVAAETTQAAHAEVARRVHMLAQFRIDLAREDKTRSASRRLAPLEFVVCPRCMQNIDDSRAQAGTCMLCLQPDASDLAARLEAPLDDSDEQSEELDRLLDHARADAAAADVALASADHHLTTMRAHLDQVTAEAVAPRFQEIELLSAGRARALADQEHVCNLLRFWAELRSLEGDVHRLDSERHRLEQAIAAARARRQARRVVLDELAALFEETVLDLRVPWAQSATIDPLNYLPLVNDEPFESLAVAGGTKTIVTVAYHLTLLAHALAHRDTLLPQLLVLDTPRKNLGSNPNDKDMGGRIYQRIRTLVDASRDEVQFIIADNDLPDDADWIKAHRFTYDQPLLPHVLHPGEEAALTGQLDTVETLRGRRP
jgi:hypothetical protein